MRELTARHTHSSRHPPQKNPQIAARYVKLAASPRLSTLDDASSMGGSALAHHPVVIPIEGLRVRGIHRRAHERSLREAVRGFQHLEILGDAVRIDAIHRRTVVKNAWRGGKRWCGCDRGSDHDK